MKGREKSWLIRSQRGSSREEGEGDGEEAGVREGEVGEERVSKSPRGFSPAVSCPFLCCDGCNWAPFWCCGGGTGWWRTREK